MERTFPYINLAMAVHPRTPITTVTVKMEGPNTATRTRISTMDGKDMNASAVLIIMDSAAPRKYPAISPSGIPITTEIIVEVIPTNKDPRPP